jgi:hypothetical protein
MIAPRYLAMVRWPDVPQWLALGWHFDGPLPAQHGEWAAGLSWLCPCAVRHPNGGEQWISVLQGNGLNSKTGNT